jgi:hypothetical protein
MTILRFTNVKYLVGGGKKPKRVRVNQNYTLGYANNYDNYTDQELINRLYYFTKGRIIPSSSTKVKRITRQ